MIKNLWQNKENIAFLIKSSVKNNFFPFLNLNSSSSSIVTYLGLSENSFNVNKNIEIIFKYITFIYNTDENPFFLFISIILIVLRFD